MPAIEPDVLTEECREADAAPTESNPFLAEYVHSANEGANPGPAPENVRPRAIDVTEFLSTKIEIPPDLVWGLVHRGSRLSVAGGSKTFKSWALLDLGCCIAGNCAWLEFKTSPGPVLFVNLELHQWTAEHRVQEITRARSLSYQPGRLRFLHLRGMRPRPSLRELRSVIVREALEIGAMAVILDPFYKLKPGVDENSTADATELLGFFEDVEGDTQASVVYAQHFSKGNQAGKRSVDRISGTGVYARDPDALLTFTAHEEPDAYVVEGVLRAHKPIDPFVARWSFPLMRRDSGLDPSDLKQPAKPGRKPQYTVFDLVGVLGNRTLSTAEWRDLAADALGVSKTRFYALKSEASQKGFVVEVKTGSWMAKPK